MSLGVALLFIVVVLISNWHGYTRGRKLGVYEGVQGSLDHLVDTGRLDVLDAIAADPYN